MSNIDPATLLRCGVDFEATDLDAYGRSRAVQIGITCWGGPLKDQVKTFESMIHPGEGIKMHPKAEEITGITQEHWKDASSFDVVLNKVLKWLDSIRDGSSVVLVAYNGHGFDYPLLVTEMERHNMNPSYTFRKHNIIRLWDAYKWCQQHIPQHRLFKNEKGLISYSLSNVYQSLLGKPLSGAHDALVDTNGMMEVMTCDYVSRKNPDYLKCDDHTCIDVERSIRFMKEKKASLDKERRNKIKTKIKESDSNGIMLTFFKKRSAPPDLEQPKKRCKE